MGLKEYRKNKNITQEQVARATGIQLRTYQNIEKSNNCTLEKAALIANYFDSTIEEIFFIKK